MILNANEIPIFISAISLLGSAIAYLMRIDRKITSMQTDIEWLKSKTSERRKNDYSNLTV